MLLKSCAMPPASVPIASSFCACSRLASSRRRSSSARRRSVMSLFVSRIDSISPFGPRCTAQRLATRISVPSRRVCTISPSQRSLRVSSSHSASQRQRVSGLQQIVCRAPDSLFGAEPVSIARRAIPVADDVRAVAQEHGVMREVEKLGLLANRLASSRLRASSRAFAASLPTRRFRTTARERDAGRRARSTALSPASPSRRPGSRRTEASTSGRRARREYPS